MIKRNKQRENLVTETKRDSAKKNKNRRKSKAAYGDELLRKQRKRVIERRKKLLSDLESSSQLTQEELAVRDLLYNMLPEFYDNNPPRRTRSDSDMGLTRALEKAEQKAEEVRTMPRATWAPGSAALAVEKETSFEFEDEDGSEDKSADAQLTDVDGAGGCSDGSGGGGGEEAEGGGGGGDNDGNESQQEVSMLTNGDIVGESMEEPAPEDPKVFAPRGGSVNNLRKAAAKRSSLRRSVSFNLTPAESDIALLGAEFGLDEAALEALEAFSVAPEVVDSERLIVEKRLSKGFAKPQIFEAKRASIVNTPEGEEAEKDFLALPTKPPVLGTLSR